MRCAVHFVGLVDVCSPDFVIRTDSCVYSLWAAVYRFFFRESAVDCTGTSLKIWLVGEITVHCQFRLGSGFMLVFSCPWWFRRMKENTAWMQWFFGVNVCEAASWIFYSFTHTFSMFRTRWSIYRGVLRKRESSLKYEEGKNIHLFLVERERT